jgi:hypothetical protein
VVLVNGIGPVYEGLGSIDLVDVIHHVEGEFRCKEGESGRVVQGILCLVGQGFELHKEDVHLILSHEKMIEAHLCVLPSTCVLEGVLEAMKDFVPIVFISSGMPCGELVYGPVGPALDPVFYVGSLDESQEQGCTLHGVLHLFCIYIGDAVQVELVHEAVNHGPIPVEDIWGITS